MSHRTATTELSDGLAQRVSLLAKYVAVSALVFQTVHLVEHVAQLGYWMAHPSEAPWLTPWAVEGRDLLAVGGGTALGNEILHLAGNLIFLGGIGALFSYCRRQELGMPSALRPAFVVQGIHVAEHVALTMTAALWGRAIGISTFFGLVSGPVMTSYRVWFHFLINVLASWLAARAVMSLYPRILGSVGSHSQARARQQADRDSGLN